MAISSKEVETRLNAAQEHIAVLAQIATAHATLIKTQSGQIELLKSVLEKLLTAIGNPGTIEETGTENSIITP